MVMISDVLLSVRNRLESALQAAQARDEEWIRLTNLTGLDGTVQPEIAGRIVMSLAALQHDTSLGSYQSVRATLVESRAERVAMLALAAQTTAQGAIAHRLAGALIGRMRRIAVEEIRLSPAKRAVARGEAQRGGLARLAAALAEADERPSPDDLARVREMLAIARGADPPGARQLLRGFAAGDASRLCAMLGRPETVAAELLPPHLADAITALARAARCSTREWHLLLAVAGGATDSDLPERLLAAALAGLARWRQVAPAGLRKLLAPSIAAASPCDRAVLASLDAMPGRTLPRLAALEQFAFLWSGKTGLAPEERASLLARLLPRLSGLAPGLLRTRLAGGPPNETKLLPRATLIRLALLLSAPKAALRAVSRDALPLAVRALIEEGQLGSTVIAPGATRRLAAERTALASPPAEGVASGAHAHRRRGEDRRIAALLRERPLMALRLIAEADDAPSSLIALVGDPQALPLLFAAMPPAERTRAGAMMRLLTGRRGRSAIPPAKLARALALASAARDWRSDFGRGFTGEWLRQLFALASLAEQAALRRLLERLPDEMRIVARREPKPVERPLPQGVAGKVAALLALRPGAPLSAIRRALEDPRRRTLLVHELAEAERIELLLLLAPVIAASLLHVAERLAAARRTGGAPLDRATQWACILAASRGPQPVPRLVALFLDSADGIPPPPPSARLRVEAALSASLEGMRDAALRIALDLRERDRKRRAAEARSLPANEAPVAIHIANAGLVLAAAFLPRLFQSLDYVVPDERGGWRWSDPECPQRAVHLLQWLADGRTDAPEPQLALNKVLCGMAVAEPVPTQVVLDDRELRMGGTLLATILASWPPLAESGADALRQTFFQREGRLTRREQGWSLEVETRVLDILLDQLPWGFSTILHPWMPSPLTVQWR